MPFEFNPQQPPKTADKSDKPSFDFGTGTTDSKPAEKSAKPSFDFGADKTAPKPAEKSTKPSFDFGAGKSAPKPADNKSAEAKLNIAPNPTSKSTSKSTSAKSTSGSKTSASDRGKRAKSPKSPFQDKRVMIFAGVGIAFALLIIVAIASNCGKTEPAPQQTVQRKMTPEEARREKLRKLEAKYEAQYAAEKNKPKTEKQKLMADAESMLNQGDYRGAADTYVKVHQLDPTDGYPVTQLINIYRNNLHDRAQVEKWEKVNNDIAKGSLDQLQKKSEEKYNKTKN